MFCYLNNIPQVFLKHNTAAQNEIFIYRFPCRSIVTAIVFNCDIDTNARYWYGHGCISTQQNCSVCLSFSRGLTDESEILKFLQHGTLVGLLPVPHPILIRKYQANAGTAMWFRTYMWGVIYLR